MVLAKIVIAALGSCDNCGGEEFHIIGTMYVTGNPRVVDYTLRCCHCGEECEEQRFVRHEAEIILLAGNA